MNKSTFLCFAALCPISLSTASARPAVESVGIETEIGQGVMCDSLQHVQRFASLRATGEDPGAALEAVNLEAHDGTACQFAFVMYTDEQEAGRAAIRARLFKFIQVTVHAVGNGQEFFQVLPRVNYTVTVEKGQIV